METNSADGVSIRNWSVLGRKAPRAELVFLCQILALYVLIGASIYNLTANKGDTNLWTAILCSSIGYLLPSPKLKRDKKLQDVLPHATE